jgi:endonuclease/exonuclease/phosphatase family metal-dependent hydrolase
MMKCYSSCLHKITTALVAVLLVMLSNIAAMSYGDFSAGILPHTVKNGEEFFLLGLDPYKMNEGGWTDFGGKPDNNETPWQTALREGIAGTVRQFSNLKEVVDQSYKTGSFVQAKSFSKQYKISYSYYEYIVSVPFIDAYSLKKFRDASTDVHCKERIHFAWVKRSALAQCVKKYIEEKSGPYVIAAKDVVSSSVGGNLSLFDRFVETLSQNMRNGKNFFSIETQGVSVGGGSLSSDSSSQVVAKSNTKSMPESSVWTTMQQGKKPTKDDKINLFKQDCQKLASLNKIIPKKDLSLVRVATYNVHYWTEPTGTESNFDEIVNAIKMIDADIIILQEVNWGASTFNPMGVQLIKQSFEKLGYKYQFFGVASENIYNAPFGNLLLSKYPMQQNYTSIFDANETSHGEKRCFVHTLISLPNNKQLSVYGTHLDVFDTTGAVRSAQIEELIKQADQDSCTNVLIAADFNEVRVRDYTKRPSMLKLLIQDNKTRNEPTPTAVAEKLAGFSDCFTYAHVSVPTFTVWNGTTIDFIYLRGGGTWDLPIVGCYVYISAASDHLPVIMDVSVK